MTTDWVVCRQVGTNNTPKVEWQTMTVWFVIVVPLAVLLFALFMERVESRLRDLAVQENEVEEFLEQAQPNEVGALYGQGIGRALELFRLRRLGPRAARMRPRRAHR